MRTLNLAIILLCSLALKSSAEDRVIRINVVDADSEQQIAARLYLQSNAGDWFYFASDQAGGTAVRYEKQNWINNNSIEYHTTVSAHSSSAKVPAGIYKFTVE